MTDFVVNAEHVHQAFGSHTVLQDLSLKVEAGQLIALFGPSGSGKTTLLNLIGTLMRPTSGHIEVFGKNIVKMSERKRTKLRRKHVGFIFQSTTLLPTYSAAENIDVALRLQGLGFFERRRRIQQILQQVGLTEWADHVPAEMSGGQRQRIAIARVLASQPSLILADEPTNGLDSRTTQQMMVLFKNIAETQATTFLMVSHDPIITSFVDEAYDLDNGQLKPRDRFDTAIQQLINDPQTADDTKLLLERMK